MAQRKASLCTATISPTQVIHKKRRFRQKETKKQKKKNVLEYGKLSEFPTFQHDKQTTSYLMIIFKKKTCIVPFRINRLHCIGITGFTHNCQPKSRRDHMTSKTKAGQIFRYRYI